MRSMKAVRYAALGIALFAAAPAALAQASSDAAGSGTRVSHEHIFESAAAAADEREAVRAAVLDYVEALYEVDPGRIERSVHKELAKRGYWRPDPARPYDESTMSYGQLHALAGRWNSAGEIDPRTAVKEIVIYDVQDQTASAKLVAHWGTDYMHLAKQDDRWMIVNVLWQSPPPRR